MLWRPMPHAFSSVKVVVRFVYDRKKRQIYYFPKSHCEIKGSKCVSIPPWNQRSFPLSCFPNLFMGNLEPDTDFYNFPGDNSNSTYLYQTDPSVLWFEKNATPVVLLYDMYSCLLFANQSIELYNVWPLCLRAVISQFQLKCLHLSGTEP